MSSKELRHPRVLALGLMLTLPSIAVAASPGGPAASGTASRQESTGAASGLVIGAAAAGPFGAVIGAATGAWFGDRWHAQRKTMLAARDLSHRFGFRTDSATLEPEATEALRQLASLAQRLPGTRLRVVGAADPRGNPDYNLALSQRRAEAVAAVLRGAGIDGDRLIVEGVGAMVQEGAAADPDGWAFARRVTVTFEPAGPTRT